MLGYNIDLPKTNKNVSLILSQSNEESFGFWAFSNISYRLEMYWDASRCVEK